jgi:hypothetical protein
MEWIPQGQRKRGRPKKREKYEKKPELLGRRGGELEKFRKNRVKWRHIVNALCSSGS